MQRMLAAGGIDEGDGHAGVRVENQEVVAGGPRTALQGGSSLVVPDLQGLATLFRQIGVEARQPFSWSGMASTGKEKDGAGGQYGCAGGPRRESGHGSHSI
jgi:hypothetical protein